MRRLMELIYFAVFCLVLSGSESEIANEVPEIVAAQEVAAAPTPSPTPEPTPKPEPEPIAMPQLGSQIVMAGIQWRVLDVYENYVLVISEYVLEQRRFHSTTAGASWESSDIRSYLNSVFLENFSEAEISSIVATEVTTDDNLWFGAPGGNNTFDKVFLLSLEEVVLFFGDSGQFANRHHPRNSVHSVEDRYMPARQTVNLETGVDWWWWLRSPGDNRMATFVGLCGRLGVMGTNPANMNGGVRPAMWIDFYLFIE